MLNKGVVHDTTVCMLTSFSKNNSYNNSNVFAKAKLSIQIVY